VASGSSVVAIVVSNTRCVDVVALEYAGHVTRPPPFGSFVRTNAPR